LKTASQQQSQATKDLAAQTKADLKALDREHTDAIKDVDKRLVAADNASEKRDAELREELLDQSAKLRDEVAEARTEINETVSRVASDLRAKKIDKSALAEMFSQLALQLSEDA
ncbi:MAG: hypothetical protein AAGK78_03140, partial [Planctomycetota bacterium]